MRSEPRRLPPTGRADACLRARPEGARALEGAIPGGSRCRPVSPGSLTRLQRNGRRLDVRKAN
jgi:hypothetical protein